MIFALPAAIRLTLHGLRGVPDQLVEVGTAHGATSRQSLWKIQLPVARPALLLGVNQTINLALGIVVIAALVGAEGLGQDVLAGLQHLDVGQAFDAGLAIVAVAIVLDRLTAGPAAARGACVPAGPHARTGARRAARRRRGGRASRSSIGKLWSSGTFPTSIDFSLHDPVNNVVEWCRDNLRNGVPIIGGTGSISDFTVIHLLDPIRDFLVNRPWWAVVVRRHRARVGHRGPAGRGDVRDRAARGRRPARRRHRQRQHLGRHDGHAEPGARRGRDLDADRAAGRHRRRAAASASSRPSARSSTPMQVMPAFVYLVPVIALVQRRPRSRA